MTFTYCLKTYTGKQFFTSIASPELFDACRIIWQQGFVSDNTDGFRYELREIQSIQRMVQ